MRLADRLKKIGAAALATRHGIERRGTVEDRQAKDEKARMFSTVVSKILSKASWELKALCGVIKTLSICINSWSAKTVFRYLILLILNWENNSKNYVYAMLHIIFQK